MRSLLLALLLILGCSSGPMRIVLTVPTAQPCQHTTRFWIDPTFRPNERLDIWQAADAWTRSTLARECFKEESFQDAETHVYRAQERRDLFVFRQYDGWDHALGVYFPISREIWIVIEKNTDVELATIAAHEFGHSFGMNHRNEPKGASIINAVLEDDFQLVPSADIPLADVRVYCSLLPCVGYNP